MAGAPRAAMFALAALASACSRREPIESCDQSLAGTWKNLGGDAERWMIFEQPNELEIYPLFPDGRPPGTPPELETAPRLIDLRREASGITGQIKRRYMRRGIECVAKAPVHVTACAADKLELVVTDPPVPVGFEPCSFSRPGSSRRERWQRE